MLISCEQCVTTYTLDDHLVSPGGLAVQCTCCGHVFMARPPPPEEHLSVTPSSENAPSAVYGGEATIPPVSSTQIFGIPSPDETPSSSPSLATAGFDHGHAAKPSAPLQAAQGSPAVSVGEADEVAYFDFASHGLGALSSSFVPEKTPVATPPVVLPSQKVAVSVRPPRPPAQSEPEAAPSVVVDFSQTGDSQITEDIPLSERLLAGDEQVAQPKSSTEELSDSVMDEIRRVEEEQAAQLQRFHQSSEFLMPAKKKQRLLILGVVVFLVVVLVAVVWMSSTN